MRKREFALFSLASNGMPVVIALSNIAFAMRMTDNDDSGNSVQFTRIFLKAVLIDDDSKWVDVKETPSEIAQKG